MRIFIVLAAWIGLMGQAVALGNGPHLLVTRFLTDPGVSAAPLAWLGLYFFAVLVLGGVLQVMKLLRERRRTRQISHKRFTTL